MRYQRFGSLRLPVWSSFTTEGIIPKLEELFREGMQLAARVSSKKEPQYDDVITRFEEIDERIWRLAGPIFFLCDLDTSTFPDIEAVKNTVEVMFIKYYIGIYLRRRIYEAAQFVYASKGFGRRPKEEQYILGRLVVTLESGGVDLPRHLKRRVRDISMKMVALENQYQRNVVLATDGWTLDQDDASSLTGIPRDILVSAKERAEKAGKSGYAISLKTHEYLSVMGFAEERSLRRKLWLAYNSRASKIGPDAGKYDNGPLMCEILQLRAEYAKLLGYEDYTAQNIGFMMADKVHVVERFLERLAKATKRKSKREDVQLRKFAHQKLGMKRVYPWDRIYVERKMREAQFGIDDEIVRAYFPMENVLGGLSQLSERLFGCTLVEKAVPAWHPSVRFFEVVDSRAGVIGGFYFDPFARPGKANGAWAYSVMTRMETPQRTQYPIVAICTNYRAPQTGEAATLTHVDMQTLFHEFGHAMHIILGKTKHRDSMAFFVEWDAVELPSQLMEEWSWKRDVLVSLSQHTRSGEKIPKDILDAIIASRHFMAGGEYGFRLTRALFDWNVHKDPPKNEAGLLKAYRDAAQVADARGIHPQFRGAHTFTHIFSGGYAAGYYGYLWSDSLVADLIAAFHHAGKNREAFIARRYRKEILAVGSARLFEVSFRAFRGRGHRTRFLLRHLGLVK